jgi:small GTP-binding protein
MQVVKPLELANQTAKLQFWDTAGGERFRLKIRDWFGDAAGFMIIYDVTDRSSFECLPMWVDYIKTTPDRARLVIVGNKSDLHDQRQVSFEEGKAFADTAGVPFIETSAKTSANVEAAVLSLACELKAKADERIST